MFKIILLSLCVGFCFASYIDNENNKYNIRPCFLKDYNCIKSNLAVNSRCDPNVRGVVAPKYTVKQARFETPYFNASYIDKNLQVIGQHRCFVSEFRLNPKTKTGILGIDCPKLTFRSERKLLQHYPLREDEVYRYYITGTYPLIRLTTTLTHSNGLNFCNAFTFAFVDQLPTFNIVPIDLQTADFLSTDTTYLNIFERETFFYRADMLVRNFVNSVLCDFGCY